MTVLSVSDAELKRLEVLRDIDRGGLAVGAAAQLLGRSERQVWRLLKAFRVAGVSGLISKKRGRPSNRKTAAAVRAALWIVRQNLLISVRRSRPRSSPKSTAFHSPTRLCGSG